MKIQILHRKSGNPKFYNSDFSQINGKSRVSSANSRYEISIASPPVDETEKQSI